MKNFLKNFEENIMVVLLPCTCVLVVISTFGRYTGLYNMYWAEEMIRYLYIFVAFLGISMGVKTDAHFSVRVVLNVLPKIIRKIVQTMSVLIEIAFLILLVYQSFLLIRRLYVMKQTSPMLHIPMFVPYTAIALGSLTMCFRVITKFIHDLRYSERLAGEGEYGK